MVLKLQVSSTKCSHHLRTALGKDVQAGSQTCRRPPHA